MIAPVRSVLTATEHPASTSISKVTKLVDFSVDRGADRIVVAATSISHAPEGAAFSNRSMMSWESL